jgi:hypothetical protein
MNIERLKEIVRNSLVDGGGFSLSTSALESTQVNQVSNDFLPDNTLQLTSAVIQHPEPADNIIVNGRGVDVPFQDMAVELTFYLEGGDAAFKLTATGDASWTLAKGFPLFDDTVADQLRFAAADPDQKPTLFLCTHDTPDGLLHKGLSFKGVLDLKETVGFLASLAGRQFQPLSGPVVLKENGSKFYDIELVAPVSNEVDLSIASVKELSFKVGSRLDFNVAREDYYATPYIELGAAIPFNTKTGGQTQNHHIPISVQITDLNRDFRFKAELNDTIDATLDELTSLTNGLGMADVLPRDVEFSSILKLNEFFFDFNPTASPKVSLIGMGVQSAKPWRILHLEESNQDLAVQTVQLTFTLFDPFDAKQKAMTIAGELKIGKAGIIDIVMRYPGSLIQGYLKPGTTLNLAEVINLFRGSATNLPEMEIDDLELDVSPDGLTLSLELEGEMQIPDAPLGLERAGVLLQKNSSGVEFSFRGLFLVGDVAVSLLANRPGADAGWYFEGSTGPGKGIPIGALIEQLADKFGHITLPSAIADLIVENLRVSFDTGKKKFTFDCESKFRVDSTDVDITVALTVTDVDGKYVKDFAGTLQVGGFDFMLHFVQNAKSDFFVATYRPDVAGKTLEVKQLVESVSSDVAMYIPSGVAIKLKDIVFTFSKTGSDSIFLFGLDIGTSINLSNLPLIGQEFLSDKTLSVDDLRLLVASKGLTQHEVADFNSLIPASVTKLPGQAQGGNGAPSTDAATTAAIPQGVTVSARINVAGTSQALSMPVAPSAPAGAPPATTDASHTADDSASDNTKWFNLQKTLGPVYFDKVGVQYQDATLRFLLNASLSGAGLTISLDGLSVGSPLSSFSPRFNLHGLGIDFQGGAVEIGAALLRTEKKDQADQYDGAAVIKTPTLALSALGSYTTVEGHPSLFIYVFLNYPIGGPAFFYVTGLAAGFGYNRKLIAPAIDKVADFPLVQQALGTAAAPADRLGALEALRDYIPPAVGEVFLAIGVKFNTFKLIDSFALLTIQFGGHFVVNILGLSRAIVPTPEAGQSVTPLAEVQIAWKATFDPEEGFLGVDARLTANSYILSRDCHLVGGYAFYSWFSGEHAGDFVQTLGGYHPGFAVPAHYPVVPRLGFNWQVSGDLTIKGDAYYALTGSALMAGGHLEVTFDQGDLKAWLKLGADFLISWKPYHYDAEIYVDVGVSYTFEIDLLFGSVTVTISVDVGADLHLWGPDFSGTADIDISVISFSISFGADASQTPGAIDWNTFKQSFLPAENVCSISVKDGLLRKMEEGEAERWIINPKHFSLVVNTAIPFKSAQNDGKELVPADANTLFGIGSMDVKPEDLHSTITITIKRNSHPADDEFSYAPIKKRVPAGLWGQSRTPGLNGNTFIEDVPAGFELTPRKGPAPGETARIDLSKFKYASSYFPEDKGYPASTGYAYVWEAANSFAPSPDVEGRNAVRTSVENNSLRDSLLKALGVAVDVDVSANVAKDFLSAPKIGTFSG